MTSSGVISFATGRSAFAQQNSVQAMHRSHLSRSIWMRPSSSTNRAFFGQCVRQYPQWMQLFGMRMSCWDGSISSGLWHQRHRRGQPFRNTVVRMPGPSSVEYF